VRVSSARMVSTLRRTSSARRVMSARLPIGVGTRNSEGRTSFAGRLPGELTSGKLIDGPRQFSVEIGYGVARIVSRQLNIHGVVCICPRWMMVHFFGDQCHAGHECEGFGEVFKLKISRELVVCLFPHIELVYNKFIKSTRRDQVDGMQSLVTKERDPMEVKAEKIYEMRAHFDFQGDLAVFAAQCSLRGSGWESPLCQRAIMPLITDAFL